MATSDKKLFLGGRLKRLRRDLGVTQSRMAEEIGVSASYLNLLERNQRPVTAQLLLRLAETYDLDLRSLSADDPGGGADLEEVFVDPLFADLGLSRHETAEIAQQSPGVAEAIVRLYRGYIDRGRLVDLGAFDRPEGPGPHPALTHTDWVRDLIGANRNHFPELETLAEDLVGQLKAEPQEMGPALKARLAQAHGVRTQVLPAPVLAGALYRYDPHRKRLVLSEAMAPSSRTFAVAYRLGLLEFGVQIADLVERLAPPDRVRRQQLRVFLGNYLAAAILIPYGAYIEALEGAAYDLEQARARFGVSYEQAAQRLTTLGRAGARGIPFFMVRVDAAGNISKRFASDAFPFSRFGGTCPRWNIHDSFKTPGRIITQIIETPDGERYFTFSRTVRRVSGAQAGEGDDLAIGLGCALKYADRLAYGRGLNLTSPRAVEIGPSCRICERPACPQRAAGPITRTLLFDESSKAVSPYPFVV